MGSESRSQRVIQSLVQARCYACGWPLGSCQPFNCSFRPNEHSPEYAGWKQRIHEMQDVALEAYQDQPVAGLGAVTPTGDSASVQCAQGRVAPAPTNSDTSSEIREPEGYPGIAHDLETMRGVLAQVESYRMDCRCSVKERDSGHHVDCHVPEFQALQDMARNALKNAAPDQQASRATPNGRDDANLTPDAAPDEDMSAVKADFERDIYKQNGG